MLTHTGLPSLGALWRIEKSLLYVAVKISENSIYISGSEVGNPDTFLWSTCISSTTYHSSPIVQQRDASLEVPETYREGLNCGVSG